MKAMVWAACCAAGLASPARAETAKADLAARAYFAGLDVRTDRATQSMRLSAGVRFGRVSANVVLDPLGYQRTGEQSDTDAFVEVDVWRGYAVFGGWRLGMAPVLGESYWHHRAFVGVSAPLPALLWGRVRTRFGAEVSVSTIKHGEDLPTMTVFQRSDPAWGLFLRAEFGGGF